MKVAVFTGIRDLEVCERPMPVLERPGDVLLQIETVGVCGSDIHYYKEGRIGGQVIEHPATLGQAFFPSFVASAVISALGHRRAGGGRSGTIPARIRELRL